MVTGLQGTAITAGATVAAPLTGRLIDLISPSAAIITIALTALIMPLVIMPLVAAGLARTPDPRPDRTAEMRVRPSG
ncbi:hypothetical protein [Nocardia paucivorans]|uniref:hypothetical protein n=1 Tax=Nocardia paucivorans TaxID=114259 RepID=UPI000318CFF5|nr:hypothetical protein [Nocardia paucivorans]